jgi:hypothetical protein
MRICFSSSRRPNAETSMHLDRPADGGRNARDNLALACHDVNTGCGSIDWLSYTTLKRGEHYDVGC